MHDVLQLDITGLPQAWISVEDAAGHVATDSVVWSAGERPLAVLRGGFNTVTGRQSMLEVPPIVALRGVSRINLFDLTPTFSKLKVIKRDRCTCAYCGEVFDLRSLTVDHIQPDSRGGGLSWMNTVAACKLSPPKSLPVHAVSECGLGRVGRKQALRTRSNYRLGLPVHRRLQ